MFSTTRLVAGSSRHFVGSTHLIAGSSRHFVGSSRLIAGYLVTSLDRLISSLDHLFFLVMSSLSVSLFFLFFILFFNFFVYVKIFIFTLHFYRTQLGSSYCDWPDVLDCSSLMSLTVL